MKDTVAIELYQSIQDSNEPRVMEAWHASSLAQCPRAQYFARKGVLSLSKPGAGKILRWNAGHLLEASIRPHIEKVYPDSVANVRLENKKLDLTGEYDNYSKKEKRLIEIKSVHDYAFKYRKNADERDHLKDEKVYLHHEIQNHAYAVLLDKEPEFIDYIYISLSGRLCTYQTKVQTKLLDWVENRLEKLNEAWKAQTPPDCQCREDNPLWGGVLQWCDYKTESGCCSLDLLKKHEDAVDESMQAINDHKFKA